MARYTPLTALSSRGQPTRSPRVEAIHLRGPDITVGKHYRYRCRYRGHDLPSWLPVAKRPGGAMLLYNLSHQHPNQVGPYLEWMQTECIATMAAEAYEVVE